MCVVVTDGTRLVRRMQLKLLAALTVINFVGMAVVIVVLNWVLPGESGPYDGALLVGNLIMSAVFLLVVGPAAILGGESWMRAGRRWIKEERAPTEREVTAVLRTPLRLFLVHAIVWFIAAVAFSILNLVIDVERLPRVAFTITLGGLVTAASAYLLTERITRPLAAAAMSHSPVDRPKLPGVVTRTLLVWTLGTAVPLIGLVLVAIFALAQQDATATELGVTMLVISGLGLLIGAGMTILSARAVADPVRSLDRAIAQVAEGDLDVRVEVYDGSVLGKLQAGFNDMTEGLKERERLRDLYGRQVGEAVAADVLDRGYELGGVTCEAAVLFVDVVGSTAIAHDLPPEEVVGLLNRFFGVVVDEVHRHGGWINKFQGDATLAVFGAPAPCDDPPGQALAAARAISDRLPADVPELAAGIGVSHGPVVAGHIGDERRFEFTVIGDPVNEAARLTELSKTYDPMVLASQAAVDAAANEERAHWMSAGSAQLRGRPIASELARPKPVRSPDQPGLGDQAVAAGSAEEATEG